MKRLLFLLAAVAFAIGCQPDSGDSGVDQPSNQPVGPEGYTSLSVSLDSTTRTTLGSRDENFIYSVNWSKEDRIAVNGTPSEEVEIDAENGANATFFFPQAVSYPFHITYPYCESTTAEKAIIELPTNREYAKGFMAPMYGYAESEGAPIALHHLTTVLHIPIRALEKDVTLSKVYIISTSGAKLSGKFEVDCQNATITPTSGCKANIIYTLPKNFKLSTAMQNDLYLVLPAIEVGSCKITFEDESGESMKTIWSASTPLARGTVREFKPISYKVSTSNREISLDDYEEPGVIPYQKYAKGDELKIMSFNVRTKTDGDTEHKAWDNRKDACVALIKDQMPSVIGFQEADFTSQWSYIKEELKEYYGAYGVNRDNGKESGSGETMGIMYNKSTVEKLDGGTFWLSETPDTPSKGFGANYYRNATWGLFKHKPSGIKFYYINTHLDHQVANAQIEGMKLISKHFDEFRDSHPVFLTGDLNIKADNVALDVIESYMNNAREVAPEGLTDFNTTYNGYITNKNSIIDHIYCSNHLKVVEYHTINEDYGVPFVSDHYPVYAIIKLK